MGWVDHISRGGRLYIGGLYALYQTDLIRAAGITHVLSVIDYDPGLNVKPTMAHLKGLWICAEDTPNEDLLKWFGQACDFVEKGLSEGGSVFVHCAMGKSRSATLVVAFLMRKYGLGWREGLRWVEEGRPVCEPNVGFKEQLGVWERMCGVEKVEEKKKIYEKWVEGRFLGEVWEWEAREREKEVKEKARL